MKTIFLFGGKLDIPLSLAGDLNLSYIKLPFIFAFISIFPFIVFIGLCLGPSSVGYEMTIWQWLTFKKNIYLANHNIETASSHGRRADTQVGTRRKKWKNWPCFKTTCMEIICKSIKLLMKVAPSWNKHQLKEILPSCWVGKSALLSVSLRT